MYAIVLALLVLAASPATQAAPTPQQELAWLRALKPLPRVMYQWPTDQRMIVAKDPRLVEVTRVMGTINLSLEWGEPAFEAAAAIARPLKARMGLHASPWHKHAAGKRDPCAWDDASRKEVMWVANRARQVAAWTVKHGLSPSEVFLDCELYAAKPDTPENAAWNDALTARYGVMYELFKTAFPSARVHWFRFGSKNLGIWADAPVEPSWFTGREVSDSYSCGLYAMTMPYMMARELRLTIEAAGERPVFAWICLGSDESAWHFDSYSYRPCPNYPLDISWTWGLIATRGPMDKATFVLYPSLWYPWGDYGCMTRHFVAFCRGVERIRQLDDLRPATRPVED